jgi:hypothetical protein
MPNNKKRNKNKKTDARSAKHGISLLKKLDGKDEDYYDAPIENRPIPDMTLDPRKFQENILALKQRQSESLTPTESRFVQAYHLIELADYNLLAREINKKLASSSMGVVEEPMEVLSRDDEYVEACWYIIRAFTSTDFRFTTNSRMWANLATPSCAYEIKRLEPIVGSGCKLQLKNFTSWKGFVILLAKAIQVLDKPVEALQIVHELHLHMEKQNESFNWKDLQAWAKKDGRILSAFEWMTQSYFRFALASNG